MVWAAASHRIGQAEGAGQALHGNPLAALRSLERMRETWSVSTDAAVVACWRAGVVVLLGRLDRCVRAR